MNQREKIKPLEKYLEFENRPELMEYTYEYKGHILWNYIRSEIINRAINIENMTPVQESEIKGSVLAANIRMAKLLLRNISKCPYLAEQNDILCLSSNVNNKEEKNGKYFNDMYDWYAELYPSETIIAESQFDSMVNLPRYFDKIVLYDFVNLDYYIRSKIFSKIGARDRDTINRFIRLLESDFPIKLAPELLERYKLILLSRGCLIREVEICFGHMLDKIKPKILFVTNCSYGGVYGILNSLAKERGIVTAEIQHGIITPAHFAYNYGGKLIQSELYRRYFPDFLLMYGDYWKEQTRTASCVKTLGNPKLTTRLASYTKDEVMKTGYLIICCAEYFDLISLIIKELCEQFNMKEQIYVRPHPGDSAIAYKYADLSLKYQNVEIDNCKDIYTSINRVKGVVSYASTVVYEAASFDIPVYVFDDNLALTLPEGICKKFSNTGQLVALLNESIPTIVDKDTLWSRDWKENYSQFIRQAIQGNENINILDC